MKWIKDVWRRFITDLNKPMKVYRCDTCGLPIWPMAVSIDHTPCREVARRQRINEK